MSLPVNCPNADRLELDIRKVEILPQTDFWGFEISPKWTDSRPNKFPQKQIICGNFNKSMPGTKRFLKFPKFWFILWKYASICEITAANN